MIEIQMAQRSDGTDVATYGDHVIASRNGAQMGLARKLVAAGVADRPYRCMRNGQMGLCGASVHALSRLTARESAGSPQIAAYKEFPHGLFGSNE